MRLQQVGRIFRQQSHHLLGIGQPDDAAAFEQIRIAVDERFRIGALDGVHHLVQTDRARAELLLVQTGDLAQVIALLNQQLVISGSGNTYRRGLLNSRCPAWSGGIAGRLDRLGFGRRFGF